MVKLTVDSIQGQDLIKLLQNVDNLSKYKDSTALAKTVVNEMKQVQHNLKLDTYEKQKDYWENNESENAFLVWYHYADQKVYPAPSVTCDLLPLKFDYETQRLQILLIKRKHNPQRGRWAMCGGFMEIDESLNSATVRETKEELNIDISDSIGQQNVIRMPAVSSVHRDLRKRILTNPSIVLLNPKQLKTMSVKAGDDAAQAQWFDVKLAQNNALMLTDKNGVAPLLAFDHKEIIESGMQMLQRNFSFKGLPLVTQLLGTSATLSEMRHLYAQVEPRFLTYDNSNLYRLYKKYLVATGKTKPNSGAGKPGVIYKFQYQ